MKNGNELFRDKVCVVTGAGSGIGLGITRQLLLRGATVYMVGRTEKKILAAGESLTEFGDKVHAEQLNVTDDDAFRSFIARVEKTHPVDYIFNNAGVGWGGFFATESIDNIRKVIDANLYGVIHG
ncbi:MAG TPA: SDR family NAD(P)-dependent oxidoreductase, partial [Smithellaceae bacterium]|nr:SDR family NAD(P)-dependent oxidoreductase [Smithellaceae bacterium]